VELVDRTMIELARTNPAFRPIIEDALIGAPEAILLVEFSGDDKAALVRRLDGLVELMGDLKLPGSVVRLEADAPGRSYTVDTLRGLHESSPADELTFIMGGDMAYSLPTWHEPEAVLELATLGVAEREGVGRADITDHLSGLAGADRIRFFDMPRIDISSSQIRRRVAAGQPLRYLVPDAVAEYIVSEGLYR